MPTKKASKAKGAKKPLRATKAKGAKKPRGTK